MALSQQQVIDELVERGVSPSVASGMAMSLKDESGFDTSINEKNPTVPGSRGGYGLAQWTGPRRKSLEAEAARRGVSASDPDLQFDHLVAELNGPDGGGAGAALEGIEDPGEAAAVFTSKFLRPAPEHEASRNAKYRGGEAGLGDGGAVGGDAVAADKRPAFTGSASLSDEDRRLLKQMRGQMGTETAASTGGGLSGLMPRRTINEGMLNEEAVYADNALGRASKGIDDFFGGNPKRSGAIGSSLADVGLQMMMG